MDSSTLASVSFQSGHTTGPVVLQVFKGSTFFQKFISVKNFNFEELLVIWFNSDGASHDLLSVVLT